MNLTIQHPAYLWLAMLAIPLAVLGWRSAWGMDRLRRAIAIGLRVTLVVLLAVLLAAPRLKREHDHLTVIGLLDISGSVRRFAQLPAPDDASGRLPAGYVAQLRDWFRTATRTRADDDRFGLVVFDGEAIAAVAPARRSLEDDELDLITVPGTSIDEAIRLGLAMFPADTARRLVLVTDGNETIGDARAAARLAAAGRGADDETGVPIDVLPIVYEVRGDVQLSRLEVPPYAQPEQTITARIVLESTAPTTGRLTLRREGVPVDLNGDAPGVARAVRVPAGVSVHIANVQLGDTPVSRFEAAFTPDDAQLDVLPDNDRIEAFTATPGPGRVLIVDRHAGDREHPLASILEAASLPVVNVPPNGVPSDLLAYQNFDLVVLDDVPSFAFTEEQQVNLARYVNDLGGGLLMIGGESSFGAGGWNGTAVEDVLPLELDPPRELRRPAAALVLVIDNSGSMARHVSGARATQQAVANEAAARAIESLYVETLIGVVTFNDFPSRVVPLTRSGNVANIADRVRSIGPGGGTDIAPALRMAHDMLRTADADRKIIVCLSDGRSPTDRLEAIASAIAGDDIRLTTIAVGDQADHLTMKRLSEIGGGQFYPVYNPTALPRVLVDSVQVINKPLIKEGAFRPIVRPTGSVLTAGFDRAPELRGLVVTGPKPEAVIELTHPEGEPLLAHWQAGLGRVSAFTSDLGGPWSSAWDAWPVAPPFWTQLVRETARPTQGHHAELVADLRDDRIALTLDVVDEDGRFMDYLEVDGTVYAPDGKSERVRLQQTGPGRYEGSAPARHAGNYIVALAPRRGTRQLSPIIGGGTRATGEEFRQRASNLPLLQEIVDMTGGRELAIASPDAVNLFDRTGMARHRSYLPAWRALCAAAIVLLLLDVANRRIAWRTRELRDAVARAWARVVPAQVRGGEAAATLATLRQTSERVDREMRDRVGRRAADHETAASRRAARKAARAAEREAPSKAGISAALARLRGRTPKPDEDATEPAPPADAATPAPDDGETREAATETTGSLLEAKRRARDRLRDRQ